MNIITLDFETFFSDDYTLSKMTTEEYVRDLRFKALGCSIRWPDGKIKWVEAADLHDLFSGDITKQEYYANCAILCHHAHFDGLILSHHYGIKPKFWFDTLSMARLMLGNHLPKGLDALAKHFGLKAKNVPYALFKGKHWHDLSPHEQQFIAVGCDHDVELTWQLFQKLAQGFPPEEYQIIDATVRMFTEPCLRGDVEHLGKVWMDEAQRKAALLGKLGVDSASLQSAEAFAALLRERGVEPEVKTSPKGNNIYAFAKTDEFMKDLLEHEDEEIRTLAEARLGQKATLNQTRAERLGFMSRRGDLCVYLNYCGAHTTRDSGGDKLNWQNFPRKGDIARGILPPEGYCIVRPDLSQIECRILNFVAGQWDVLEAFRRGDDLYSQLATKFYGREITKANPEERGVGKQLELSCGYGAGAATIKATAKRGTYGPPVIMSDEESLRARDLYRDTHRGVVDYWATAGRMLSRLASPDYEPLQWGPLTIAKGCVWLPNGCPINYQTLEYYRDEESGEGFWRVKKRNGWTKLYGAKLVENVVQGLARVVMFQALLRLQSMGYRHICRTHDDAAFLLKRDGSEQKHLDTILGELTKSPSWLPDIPLAAEGEILERYAK